MCSSITKNNPSQKCKKNKLPVSNYTTLNIGVFKPIPIPKEANAFGYETVSRLATLFDLHMLRIQNVKQPSKLLPQYFTTALEF